MSNQTRQLGGRRHKLVTKEIEAALPPLYSTEETPTDDKRVIVKFFSPYSQWTWFAVEGERQEDGDILFFGLVHGFENEWGYFTLNELADSYRGDLPLVERDCYCGKPGARTIAQHVNRG